MSRNEVFAATFQVALAESLALRNCFMLAISDEEKRSEDSGILASLKKKRKEKKSTESTLLPIYNPRTARLTQDFLKGSDDRTNNILGLYPSPGMDFKAGLGLVKVS